MAGRFTQQFIDDLLARVDIVDLVESRVPLKARGASLIACCPFHSERTPSFNVNRSKQFYHCFGCGAHGDAIAFLMAFDRLAFPEAVASLAQTAGIALPDAASEDPGVVAERRRSQRICETLEQAARFYGSLLASTDQGAQARDYLQQRGISRDSIERFRLGYAPAGWNVFPANWDRDELRDAGLVVAKDKRFYDRFRDRLMFPIRDRRGRTVGFGGRVLDDSSPKYLNSPETAVFKKHREVYGLFEALEAERSPERILLVEGYLDVISLAQFGLTSTVATLGTATSAEHLEILFRHTDEVVFCFDGDAAGVKAARKALEVALPILPDGKTARFLRLPEATDPDSLVRAEGPAAFSARVASAPPLSDYFFSELSRGLSMETLEGRARLVKLATPLLNNLKPGPFRQMMMGKLADLTTRRGPAHTAIRPRGTRHGAAPSSLRPSAHVRMLALLVRNPSLAELISEEDDSSAAADPSTGALYRSIIATIRACRGLTGTQLHAELEALTGNPAIAGLLSMDLLVPEAGLEAEFIATLQLIAQQVRERRLDELIRLSRAGELDHSGREEMRRLIGKPRSDN